MAVTDRADINSRLFEIEASAPRDALLFTTLLDEVVHRLTEADSGPTSALALAGQVVRNTPWAHYRSGRARLASAAAAYISWVAPPAPWRNVPVSAVGRRRPLGWCSPDGELVIDVLATRARDLASAVAALRRNGSNAVVIRAIDVSAPMRSRVYLPGGLTEDLANSQWAFEGRGR